MQSHKCPWCGNPYLITDKELQVPQVRELYQEHLNKGCNPTLHFTIGKIATSMYQIQKDYIA